MHSVLLPGKAVLRLSCIVSDTIQPDRPGIYISELQQHIPLINKVKNKFHTSLPRVAPVSLPLPDCPALSYPPRACLTVDRSGNERWWLELKLLRHRKSEQDRNQALKTTNDDVPDNNKTCKDPPQKKLFFFSTEPLPRVRVLVKEIKTYLTCTSQELIT